MGNATIDKPSGISTLASGATSVRITSSVIPDPATTRLRFNVTPHNDPGSRWWVEQGNGFFDFKVSSAAPTNVSFSWEVNGIT